MSAARSEIEAKRKISFRYTDYDIHKNRILTNDGNPYTVSPYTLLWDGEYYYMLGFCDERQAMRTYRLDRIETQPDILRAPAAPSPIFLGWVFGFGGGIRIIGSEAVANLYNSTAGKVLEATSNDNDLR